MSGDELFEDVLDDEEEEEEGFWEDRLDDEDEEALWEDIPGDEYEEEEQDKADEARWESPLFDQEMELDEIPRELLVSLDADEDEAERDLAEAYHYDTQHGDGHTFDVGLALDQGLTYTPPTDPPVLPSAGHREGLDMAAGFALSMEDSDPDIEVLPAGIDDSDLDLEEDVYEAIRFNSETQHLTDLRVRANNGIVALFGTVADDQDVELLVDLIEDLPGVEQVLSHLAVEEEEPED